MYLKRLKTVLIILKILVVNIKASDYYYNYDSETDYDYNYSDSYYDDGPQIAEYGEFPYIVSLQCSISNLHLCGGAIISSKHVLTAAHCVVDKDRSVYRNVPKFPDTFKICAGVTCFSDINIIGYYTALYIVIHEWFNLILLTHDIAIITINEVFQFSNYVQMIPLYPYEVPDGTELILSGWGIRSHEMDGHYSECQLWTTTYVYNLQKCMQLINSPDKYLQVNLNHMCIWSTNNHVSRAGKGDSGGPLVLRVNGIRYMVSLVSWGSTNNPKLPAVTLKIYSYLNWIEMNTNSMFMK